MTKTEELVFAPVRSTQRVHAALSAGRERALLEWVARRLPRPLTADHLTGLGVFGQGLAGAAYALSGDHRRALWLASLGLFLNWAGDSLDGTVARVRGLERPRFGFYVDHVLDCLGATLLLGGMGCSGLVHPGVAAAMLVSFLLLASESYLAAHTLGRFALSQGWFGPTELRALLIAANCALLHSPFATLFGRRWLLLDLGGVTGAAAMLGLFVVLVARHSTELARLERLP